MVFSSITFLFLFLPVVVTTYHMLPRRARNAWLLLTSLLFYTWGAGWIVLVLSASIAWNYVLGHAIEHARSEGHERVSRRLLAIGVVANVGALAWFKYANFGVGQLNGVLGTVGVPPMPWATILLPIGISFFTFHSLSYLMDVYRGTARHLVNPLDFALYIAFFPQLIAGPIVRFHEIRDQLVDRTETPHLFAVGVYRFAHGLGKKVLIADTVAPVADAVFGSPAGDLGTAAAILGILAFTVQLYFDFSGYSDMAIGIALMFGIKLPENFARPYASRSVTEFWRRWHMSLSRWFRDYLYVPLGGNRGTQLATYRNLVIVFLVTGLWHGAAWTFVLWGAYHGILLLVERRLGIGRPDSTATRGADRFGHVRTVVLVSLGWVLFRAASIPGSIGYLGAFLRPELGIPADVSIALDPLASLALAVGALSVVLPASWVTGLQLELGTSRRAWTLRAAEFGLVLPLALVFATSGGFSPFLYFQF
jgi:alginate O-acetyltransferase complex protein AlgI